MSVTYPVQVEATLYVHLANGTEFPAKPEDLAKFGYVDRSEAYYRFAKHMAKVLRDAGLISGSLTEAKLNTVRYLLEVAIYDYCGLSDPEMGQYNMELIQIERALQAADVPAEAG